MIILYDCSCVVIDIIYSHHTYQHTRKKFGLCTLQVLCNMDNYSFQASDDTPSRFAMSTTELDEELREADQMTLEMDHVSDMLTRLASHDTEVSKAAQEEIDKYLLQKERRKDQDSIKNQIMDECNTISERTVINDKESTQERCKKLSEEYKSQVQ